MQWSSSKTWIVQYIWSMWSWSLLCQPSLKEAKSLEPIFVQWWSLSVLVPRLCFPKPLVHSALSYGFKSMCIEAAARPMIGKSCIQRSASSPRL